MHTRTLGLAIHKNAQYIRTKMQVLGSSQQCLETPFNIAVIIINFVRRALFGMGLVVLAIQIPGQTK